MTLSPSSVRLGGPASRRSLASLLLSLLCLLALPAWAQQSPTAGLVQWRTTSGVRVLFAPAPALPVIDLAINIDAGGRWEPEGLEGLSGLTADLTGMGLSAEGGQPAIGEADFERQFGALAAQRSTDATEERVVLKARFLSDPEVRVGVAQLLGRQLAHPAFDAAIFERERQRSLSGLKEELTRPQTLAMRALFAGMYPAHPYGRPSTEASLARLTARDVQAFHARLWRPERMQVVIVGALTRSEAEALVEKLLQPLSERLLPQAAAAAGAQWPLVLPALQPPKAELITLEHPASQSHIWLGLPILARQEQDDYFPLLLANHVLGGGGFTSRLMFEVRESRGLSYSVFSALAPRAQAGPLMIGLQTQREKAPEALKVVQETLKRFQQEGPTDSELVAAKKNLLGGFALRLDTNRKLVDALSEMAFYGLPLTYLDTWSARVEAVTNEDIRRVLSARLLLDRITTVVVGGKAAQ